MSELSLGLLALTLAIAAVLLLLGQRQESPAEVDELAPLLQHPSRGWMTAFDARLRSLNRHLRLPVLLAALTLVSVLVWMLFSMLLPTQPLVPVLAGVVVLPVSVLVIKDLAAWQTRRFETALVDVVDLVYAASSDGTPPLLALEVAAKASPRLIRVALADLVRRIRLGSSIEVATAPLLQRYPSEGAGLFINMLRSHWYAGAEFKGLLGALGHILRERRSFRQTLQGKLSGARYALIFAAFFPYIMIPFFLWKEPRWLLPLTQHAQGPTLMFLALMAQVVGFLWMRRILRMR